MSDIKTTTDAFAKQLFAKFCKYIRSQMIQKNKNQSEIS